MLEDGFNFANHHSTCGNAPPHLNLPTLTQPLASEEISFRHEPNKNVDSLWYDASVYYPPGSFSNISGKLLAKGENKKHCDGGASGDSYRQ